MKYLLATLLLLLTTTLFADDAEHTSFAAITTATDLHADGKTAKTENKAILLLVSQEHCSFCVQIKREVISPMLRSGNYTDTLLIRELILDGVSTVIDFKGTQRDNHSFAYDYKVSVTPTLLFLDAEGKELSEQMVGIQTPDMYYYYVDQSVQEEIKAIGHQTKL
ncbi:thioredoxin family protein [Sedimenticola selenatireducens]|uniref:Thioredoxin-like fold domain-containing protein n=1 Tax=Sedimenticola selenatireducens TaxID=191960 RepID=A0A2N6CRV2_9GAMM|nr:thioredoxin fold domain-containing protein [Sedimenticola selenatireducens]PLX59810.1 MAG: hypothetical protein C0630_17995 [Sedimenticola selenatireducens]